MYGILEMILLFIISVIGIYKAKNIRAVWIWWGVCIFGVLDGMFTTLMNVTPDNFLAMLPYDIIIGLIIAIIVSIIITYLENR